MYYDGDDDKSYKNDAPNEGEHKNVHESVMKFEILLHENGKREAPRC